MQDPVATQRVSRLDEERAQRPVGQAIGREVQIVEHHQGPKLERRVDRAARGARDHRGCAELLQAPDVGPVGDLIGEPNVTRAVP